MRIAVVTGIFSLVCWAVFLFSFKRDRSRYRNCLLLFFAICSLFPFIISLSGEYAYRVAVITLYFIIFSLLTTPFCLIINGIFTIKREGRHIAHLLSLVLGLVILVGEVTMIVNIGRTEFIYDPDEYHEVTHSLTFMLVMLFCASIIYISMSVLIFTLYIELLQKIPWRKSFDYIIILGAGLIDGEKLSKLLRDRVDKAIEVYNKLGTRPKLIPSGGQGADESIPEAEAMRRYLIEKGIPEEDIIKEDKSTTTNENLTNSKAIIDAREGEKRIAIVSSNYHVYRALRYCRRLGIKCTGIGGHTAFYYWPSALIREYIAVHSEKKHAVLLVVGWALTMVCTWWLMQ